MCVERKSAYNAELTGFLELLWLGLLAQLCSVECRNICRNLRCSGALYFSPHIAIPGRARFPRRCWKLW